MPTPTHGGGHPVPLYGVTIHHCIAEGDLGKMKQVLADAEKYLTEYGDVGAAVEVLKAEIAKAEAKKR
jgi:Domain of unknown function (DUF1843)